MNSFIVVSVLLFAAAFVHGAPGRASDQVQAAKDVMKRLIPSHADKFQFNIVPRTVKATTNINLASTKYDTYTVAASNGVVYVNATSGVALTAGSYWYLKSVAKCQMTWGVNRTGDQFALPAVLPSVEQTTTTTIVPWRYAWNMCTFDYSAVWWDAARWQREIDWMAMHGINLPLALVGQEYVWMEVFKELGASLDDLESWFTGPAFLAWQRAGNIRGFAGPLPERFIDHQKNLQLSILQQMRSLGMTPVLPCFGGHVPKVTAKLFPNATISQSPGWNNFPLDETDVYVLDPSDPLYKELGKRFLKKTMDVYGYDGYYSCDTFNEVDPTSVASTYLGNASKAVLDGIRGADPAGVWVIQAWLFHFDFWKKHPERVKAYLDGVPNDGLLILDLNSEMGALAPLFDQYYGKYWVWNMLHNYGGVRGVYGNLTEISVGPLRDLNRPGSTMIGIGFTPEAIEQNPVMYEMLTTTFYHAQPVPVLSWLKDYVRQRYGAGAIAAGAWEAWHQLFHAVYNQPGEPRSEIEHPPDFITNDYGWENGNATGMMQSFQTFLKVAETLQGAATNGPFQYDFVDVTRQATTMFFSDAHRMIDNIIDDSEFADAFKSNMKATGETMLEIISLLDDLLGTNPNYLMGTWVNDALLRAGDNATVRKTFMYNAKNQVTLWGPSAQIGDYAAKAWNGLYRDYYLRRWTFFVDRILKTKPASWVEAEYQYDLLQVEKEWCVNDTVYRTSPNQKDSLTIAKKLNSIMHGNLSQYSKFEDQGAFAIDMIINPMWTRDPAVLARLCDMYVECIGFDTHGIMKKSLFALVPEKGTTVYIKKGTMSHDGKTTLSELEMHEKKKEVEAAAARRKARRSEKAKEAGKRNSIASTLRSMLKHGDKKAADASDENGRLFGNSN